MKHQLKLTRTPFEKMKKGNKIIESRLFDEKIKSINIGDLIEFKRYDKLTEIITVEVKALYCHATFNDLFSNYPVSDFGGNSKEELLTEIHQFYTSEDENKISVVGIKIELVN